MNFLLKNNNKKTKIITFTIIFLFLKASKMAPVAFFGQLSTFVQEFTNTWKKQELKAKAETRKRASLKIKARKGTKYVTEINIIRVVFVIL